MLKRINKALLVSFVALFVIFAIGTAWNNLKPYTIHEWQIDNKNGDWHIPQINSTYIQNLNDSTICNISRYQTALIQKAENTGIPRTVLTKVFATADKEGPKGKLPVYVQTAKKDNHDVIIIVYKTGLGWTSRLAEVKPFIPISVKSEGMWAVMVQKDNGKVILSDGTM